LNFLNVLLFFKDTSNLYIYNFLGPTVDDDKIDHNAASGYDDDREVQKLELEEDRELKQLQDSVLQVHIAELSRIGRKDFEKLVKMHMANADLAHLTFLQYFYNTLVNT
jgi:hypothetical protein